MKKKQWITAVLFLLLAVFFVPSKAEAAWSKEKMGTKSYWFYYTSTGKKQTGWLLDNGKWYYLDSAGRMRTGWITVNKKRYYLDDSGAMASGGWKLIDKKWYYFAASGETLTGWLNSGGKYYYLAPATGEMYVGLKRIGNYYYYFNQNGDRATGWIKLKGGWLYANGNGVIYRNCWINVNNKLYYTTSNGLIHQNGVKKIGSYYYGFNADGALVKGWYKFNGKYYYFHPTNGVMFRNRAVKSNGKTYWLGSDGVMVTSKWVNNYYLNASGAIVYNTWVGSKYVGSDGHPLKGFQKVGSAYYYFNDSTGNKLTNTTKTINGVEYYFNAAGVGTAVQTGNIPAPTVDVETTYYTDPNVSGTVLLAAIIYSEAGNQPYYGQVAVGMVITNRMRSSSFPRTLREVIYQKQQFEPARNGALTKYLTNPKLISANSLKAAQEVVQKYKTNVRTLQLSATETISFPYLFFMTPAAYQRLGLSSPYRAIGDHVFFTTWQY